MLIKNISILLLIAYLFYGTVLVALPGIVLLFPLMKRDYKKAVNKKRNRLRVEFREALQSMRTAMRSGYAVENAMKETQEDMTMVYGKDAAIVEEYRKMNAELAMRFPAETVWREFGERSQIEEIREFSAVFQAAKRSGGDMIAIIDHAIENISNQLEVQQEIETMLSGKRLEWRIMTIIPFAIILYMRVAFPGLLTSLYGNLLGILVMTGSLGVFAIAFLIGERIIMIEEQP